ncbi:hypothetical protein C9374_009944 [Naegleria lovaniensis]|uniref:Protein kinase domain-containing protein n=1 Tax=Naegleria lovaniensis TaxID=51637 RepID=A0AA88KGY3_NAELO|nr:uncharacterized protein C9374_009944 [Naegleria lovaniensis]KAG2375321.1 hypothetical protein C9374_009944 [Naegleria lovaniensis]
MTNLMKKLMVKIATNHHTVKAKPVPANEGISMDEKPFEHDDVSSIYDETNQEWITQHNPLFDCNFATLLEITDGVMKPQWTTTSSNSSNHHHHHTFRIPSYLKTTTTSCNTTTTTITTRKRRGSSILSLAQHPSQGCSSPSPRFVAKMEFESDWQVQEHFMAKFESVERLSRKPNSCLYQVKHSEHDSTRRILRLIQAESASHAKQLVDSLVNIQSNIMQHECFVQIHDVCMVGETTVAVEMEYIELGDLQTFLEEEGLFLSDEMVQQVIVQVCHALQLLQEKKTPLTHGQIRPQNILIRSFNDDTNEIKIALSDFGWKSPNLNRSSRDKRFVIPSSKLISTSSELSNKDNTNMIACEIFHLGVSLYQLCSRDKEVILSQLYEQQDLDEMSVREALAARLTKHYQYRAEVVDVILQMISPIGDNFGSLTVNGLLSSLNMVAPQSV